MTGYYRLYPLQRLFCFAFLPLYDGRLLDSPLAAGLPDERGHGQKTLIFATGDHQTIQYHQTNFSLQRIGGIAEGVGFCWSALAPATEGKQQTRKHAKQLKRLLRALLIECDMDLARL